MSTQQSGAGIVLGGTPFTGVGLPSALPVVYQDPMLTVGTKFIFDFTNAQCNPNADGVLPAGATFNNLVATNLLTGVASPKATFNGTPGTLSSATGKKGLVNSAANYQWNIDYGDVWPMNATNTGDVDHEFVAIDWIKFTAGNFSVASNEILASNEAVPAWRFDVTAAGLISATFNGGAQVTSTSAQANAAAGAPCQLAIHAKPTLLEFYINNVKIGSSSASAVTTFPTTWASHVVKLATFEGTAYRSLMEDLAISGRAATDVIAADYCMNTAGHVASANNLGVATRSGVYGTPFV